MEEKITAWVARDETGLLRIYFYDKPIKREHWWDVTDRGESRYIENDKFPQVKWEDEEPTEIELTIKICE